MFREALAIDRKAYGNDHEDVATRLNNIGQVLSQLVSISNTNMPATG